MHCIRQLIATCVISVFSSFTVANDNEFNRDDKISVSEVATKIIFKNGERKVLVFNHKDVKPPKGIDKIYTRSGYIHPLYSPAGKVVTDDFSDDHAHQHGLFHAFVKAKVDGEMLDFWNQQKRTANVKCDSVLVDPRNPSRIKTVQTHYRSRDEKPIFKETWTIDVSSQKGCNVVDLMINIVNISGEKVVIEKNHYGSFGLRGSGQWRNPDKTAFEFVTSSEHNRKTGNLKREKWVAMVGKVDGKFCGVAVIAHQDNFRHPQPARLHPTMPYFSFAPMNLGSYDILNEQGSKSQFRIVTFDGKLDRKKIESLAIK